MSAPRFPTLIDGRLYAPGEGTISADDAGFLLGLSAFETVLYEHGWPHFLDAHLKRLGEGLRALSIELPPERDLRADIERFRPAVDARLAELGKESAALRITVSRGAPDAGPTVVLGARAVVLPPAEGVVVTWEPNAKQSRDALEELKTTSRLRNVLMFEEARRRGAWDALMGNELGNVCEATIANAWCVVDGVVATPDLESGCLSGVTRERLLRVAERAGHEVRVGPLPIDDVARASEVFLSNSTGRVIPVNTVLGVVDGLRGPDGPIARELREGMRRAEAEDRAAV